MDEKEQAEGERRVRRVLIQPLEDLGLGKPTTTNRAQFERMKDTICQGLAWMGETDLAELCEWCKRHPGGPQRDRFPIGNQIMQEARKYQGQKAATGPSPLFRNVFASQLGADAIEGGWAPELLKWLRDLPFGERKWPGSYTISQIKQSADRTMTRWRDLEFRAQRGDGLAADEALWLEKRRAALAECQAIRETAQREAAA